MKTLVIGCGYLGLPLARRERKAGHEVIAWVRSSESAAALATEGFARIITGSVADERLWASAGAFDRAILAASSGRGGPEAYREVFLEGARQMARQHPPSVRKIFVSSTSVYGQSNGEEINEASPAEPSTETGKILREAEDIARQAGVIIVRSSGIYGPGRAFLFEKLRRGEATMEGDGSRWMNQIHRDDLVEAISLLWTHGRPGEIYNATDNTPVRQRDYFAWCCEFLRVPLPPSAPPDPNRKRGLTSKRVGNARLRALGWTPRYPSFREGLAADYSPR